MFLEVVIIRYCHTVACGHETAHTTRAVVTCTGLAIAQLQTVSLVGGSDRAQKIMLAMSALTVINLLIFRVIRAQMIPHDFNRTAVKYNIKSKFFWL